MSYPKVYCTTFCNHAHNVKTGRPIGHECRIIPPAAIKAEIDGDYTKAINIMQSRQTCIVRGRRAR